MRDLLRLALALLVGISIAAAAIDFLADADHFLLNVLAEVMAIALFVLIGHSVIEVLLARARRKRWEAVREQMLHSIFSYAGDMGVDFLMSTPGSSLMDPDDARKFRQDIDGDAPGSRRADALKRLAGFIRDHQNEFADFRGAELDFVDADRRSRSLYDDVREELTFLRDVVTPLVRDGADDPQLAELLCDVASAERSWRHALWLIEHDSGTDAYVAWCAVASVYDAVAAVAAYVTTAYPELPLRQPRRRHSAP